MMRGVGMIFAAVALALILVIVMVFYSHTEQFTAESMFTATSKSKFTAESKSKKSKALLYECPLSKMKAKDDVKQLVTLRKQWDTVSDAIDALLTKSGTEGFHNSCESNDNDNDNLEVSEEESAEESLEEAKLRAENEKRRKACRERIGQVRKEEGALYSRYNSLVNLINKKIEGSKQMIEAKRREKEENNKAMDAMAKI